MTEKEIKSSNEGFEEISSPTYESYPSLVMKKKDDTFTGFILNNKTIKKDWSTFDKYGQPQYGMYIFELVATQDSIRHMKIKDWDNTIMKQIKINVWDRYVLFSNIKKYKSGKFWPTWFWYFLQGLEKWTTIKLEFNWLDEQDRPIPKALTNNKIHPEYIRMKEEEKENAENGMEDIDDIPF